MSTDTIESSRKLDWLLPVRITFYNEVEDLLIKILVPSANRDSIESAITMALQSKTLIKYFDVSTNAVVLVPYEKYCNCKISVETCTDQPTLLTVLEYLQVKQLKIDAAKEFMLNWMEGQKQNG